MALPAVGLPAQPVIVDTRGRARLAALEIIMRELGLDGCQEEPLFTLAGADLGESRAERCIELIELAPAARRWAALSATAALVAATRRLGPAWWSQAFQSSPFWPRRPELAADEILGLGHVPGESREDAGSCLPDLANWAMDDAADADWGRPLAAADLNSFAPDAVVLPPDARPGQVFIAWFDPGSRVDVHVVERDAVATDAQVERGFRRGSLGSQFGDWRFHHVADLAWAWGVLAGGSIWSAAEMQAETESGSAPWPRRPRSTVPRRRSRPSGLR